MSAVRDMLGEDRPGSMRKLAGRPGLNKHRVRRWRTWVQKALASASDCAFAGVVEGDEAPRESRNGSRGSGT